MPRVSFTAILLEVSRCCLYCVFSFLFVLCSVAHVRAMWYWLQAFGGNTGWGANGILTLAGVSSLVTYEGVSHPELNDRTKGNTGSNMD